MTSPYVRKKGIHNWACMNVAIKIYHKKAVFGRVASLQIM